MSDRDPPRLEIGNADIDPSKLPLTFDNTRYGSRHLFLVARATETAEEVLRLYVGLVSFHVGILMRNNLQEENVIGGGSCYLNDKNEIVLGDRSGEFGQVPMELRMRFATMIADIVRNRGIPVANASGTV